ncbi:MAG: preprotein translocase subunit YajC [Hyphomonas sp.]
MMNKIAVLGSVGAIAALPASATAAGAGSPSLIGQLVFFVPLILIFYFLIIRPQSQRAKKHKLMVENIKKGDTIVSSGGLVGKVHKVADTEITVDLGENMRVRLVKGMVMEVRGKDQPVAAND